MGRHILSEWVLNALIALRGQATIKDVHKHIWKHHQKEIESSEDLFYNWQYEVRWAASKLRKDGRMKTSKDTQRGKWELNPEKIEQLIIEKQVHNTRIVERAKSAASLIEPIATGTKPTLGHNNPPQAIKENIVVPQKEWRNLLRRVKKIEKKPDEDKRENISSLRIFVKKIRVWLGAGSLIAANEFIALYVSKISEMLEALISALI